MKLCHSAVLCAVILVAGCSESNFAGESRGKESPKKKSQAEPEDSKDLDTSDEPEDSKETSKKTNKKKPVDQEESSTELVNNESEEPKFEDISVETGTVRCLDVEDDAGSQEIGSRAEIRNAGRLAINKVVNDACQANSVNSWIGSGAAVVGTPETAEAICRTLGFKVVADSVTDSFSSPGNNQVAIWDAPGKRFNIVGANVNNIWFGYIQCKQKLKAACMKDIKVKCGG